ncbi:MAG: hypothetical protein EBZ59_10665, partial [Planctomycetia bacterium]|nr:hypothetical protein [Planctomycetia bacterium]
IVGGGRVFIFTHRQQLKSGAKPPAARYPVLADEKKATMAPQELDAYEELRVEEQLTRLREFYDQADAIHCLDATSGATLWAHQRPSGPTRWRHSSTPVWANGRLFYLGADRAMNCLDAADGRLLWTTPLPFAPESEEPMVSSPVVVGDLVVVGAGRLLAYAVDSGRIVWQADAAATRGIYSSPTVWQSPAGPCLVANGSRSKTVCVEAATGKILWSEETFSDRASPTVVGDRLVTFGGSRKGGVQCYRLAAAGPELVWKNQELSDAGSSPGVGEGLVFVQSGGSLVCLGLDDGAERWRLPIAAPSARSDHPATRRLP